MTPVRTRRHQEFQGTLLGWLHTYWAMPRGCRVYPPINSAGPDGWLASAATGVLFRVEPGDKLAVQLADQAETLRLLPE
jgi:hypothetical protein